MAGYVVEEVEHKLSEGDHSCACKPDKTTKRYFWCDKNGNPGGPFMCCGVCKKVCSASTSEEPARETNPVLPIAPPCESVSDHASGCASGTGRCTKCGHPCPNGPPLEAE